jgi:hypothetical protein
MHIIARHLTPAAGLFQAPLIALQASMPLADLASATSALVLFRTLGGSLGISMAGAILSSQLSKNLQQVPDFQLDTSSASAALSVNLASLQSIQPPELRAQVLYAFTDAIRWVWVVCTPLAGAGFVGVCFLRVYTLKRPVVRQGGKDAEKGEDREMQKRDSEGTLVGEQDTAAGEDKPPAKA